MNATVTSYATWRKTRDGEWVIMGNAKELQQAAKTYTAIPARKANGRVDYVQIARVGKTFGDGMAYGYLGTNAPATRTSHTGRRACITGGNCSSFGTGRSCGGHDCDGH